MVKLVVDLTDRIKAEANNTAITVEAKEATKALQEQAVKELRFL
jgi:hypothetical protein